MDVLGGNLDRFHKEMMSTYVVSLRHPRVLDVVIYYTSSGQHIFARHEDEPG